MCFLLNSQITFRTFFTFAIDLWEISHLSLFSWSRISFCISFTNSLKSGSFYTSINACFSLLWTEDKKFAGLIDSRPTDVKEGNNFDLFFSWLSFMWLEVKCTFHSRFLNDSWALSYPPFGSDEHADMLSYLVKSGMSPSFFDVVGSSNDNSSESLVSWCAAWVAWFSCSCFYFAWVIFWK